MNEPKWCVAIYSVTVVAGLITCASVVATIGPSANAQTTNSTLASPPSPTPAVNPNPAPPDVSGLAFSEDFKTPTSYKERFDYGWFGEWNAGSMWHGNRNDWHADHGMTCENPNISHRTIHLTSQQQASDAAIYHCMPDGDKIRGT